MPDYNLLEMLTYRRPYLSRHERKFARRFLEPVFGPPDLYGNYILTVRNNPNRIAFMAHYDTVHAQSGRQKVNLDPETNVITAASPPHISNCLGADCTTGVWLILEMIANDVPGLYIVHAGEERGCIGSRALVRSRDPILNTFDFAISFDRKGTTDIITHQMGMRTCSNKFAKDLAFVLGLDFKPDPTGSYTVSCEYADLIPECTNISVGYYNQHTKKEWQDYDFALLLRDRLIDPNTNWGMLKPHRDPAEIECDYGFKTNRTFYGSYVSNLLIDLVQEYPEEVAEVLQNLGYTAWDLAEEIGVDTSPGIVNRMIEYM